MAEELDSWEDMESSSSSSSTIAHPSTSLPPSFKLNANAPSFSFNPSAPSFTPPPFPAHPSFVAAAAAPPTPVTSLAPEPFPPSGLEASAQSAAPAPTSQFQGPTDMEVSETGASIVRSPPEENGEDDRVEMDVEKEPVHVQKEVAENGPTADQVDKAATTLASMKLTEGQSKQDEEQIADHSEGCGDEHSEGPAEHVDEESDKRQHLNVVFIGHVDAGKSTIGGQTLYLSNMVDERTIQKYEREAKEKNRDSWYMAYIMDTNEEERTKGKTVEVGRAHFETEKTRFTILDAPGHKSYVPNMISGASQADIGVLVISARKGEFETGYEKGGQTREHVQLAKTLGVSKLLVVVNKMDEPTVLWSKERFDEIEKKLIPFLRSCGYNVKKDVQFLPISGLYGINMKERIDKSVCPWWSGPCLFEALDAVELPLRDPEGSFRMPLIDKFRDMGTVVMGKIQSGTVRRGDSLIVMPNKAHVKVITLYRDADEVNLAKPGENLRIRLSGVEEEDVSPGFVLSSVHRPIPAVTEFDAQLQILDLLDHKAIFTAGYKAIIHIHSVVEECEIIELLQQIDPKTKKPIKKKVLFVKSGAVVVVRILVSDVICVERFEDFPQLGRFTLRDEGKTVAIGKVVDLPKVSHHE